MGTMNAVRRATLSSSAALPTILTELLLAEEWLCGRHRACNRSARGLDVDAPGGRAAKSPRSRLPVEPFGITVGGGILAAILQWRYLGKIGVRGSRWLVLWILGLVEGLRRSFRSSPSSMESSASRKAGPRAWPFAALWSGAWHAD